MAGIRPIPLRIALALSFSITAWAHNPTVEWIKCPVGVTSPVECGQIQVPLDHAIPDGETITLSVTRLQATNPGCGPRQGLYIENGGPGEPNVQTPSQLANALSTGGNLRHWLPLVQNFDIIGVDMRGTGRSNPVQCDKDLYTKVQWPMIKDHQTYDETMARAKEWGETCVNMTGPLMNHLGTDQAIHDYEMVRQALEHDKFNYLGLSYGTQIGSEYSDMYPDHVGRMVLDGVTNRHMHEEDRMTTFAAGLDTVLADFFRWCNATTTSALYGRDQAAILDWIIDTAAKGQLFSTGCNDLLGVCGDGSAVSDWLIMLAIETSLHDGAHVDPTSKTNYQAVSYALNYTYSERSGVIFQNKPPPANTTVFSELAITCSDRSDRVLSVEDFRNIWTVTPLIAPHSRGMGIVSQALTVCTGWPVKPLNPPRDFNLTRQRSLPPVMLVNSFYDEATVSPWGLGMRANMPTAFSIYRNGSGHTSFSLQGDTAGAITAFLANGSIPKDGTIYQS
ncbi:alpha/beta-hydrolase [Trichoderma afarasin]